MTPPFFLVPTTNEQVMLLFTFFFLLTSGLLAGYIKKIHATLPSRRLQLVLANTLVLLVLLSAGLWLGELYFRHLLDTSDSFGMSLIHEHWMRRHWHTNTHGLRDDLPAYTVHPPEGKPRLVFVGDSFTAGHGIPEVSNRFANLYRARHPELDVHINAQNGWDTDAHLDMLNDLVRQGYAFDAVVLASVLNDTNDLNPAWHKMNRRLAATFRPTGYFRHSFLLNWLYFRAKVARDPDFRNYGQSVRSTYAGGLWEQQKQRLREMHNIATAQGARFFVVLLPFFNYPCEQYPFHDVHQKIADFWKEEGVPCLDLEPLLKGRTPRQLTVNRFDAHPNETAHRLIADALEVFLSGAPIGKKAPAYLEESSNRNTSRVEKTETPLNR